MKKNLLLYILLAFLILVNGFFLVHFFKRPPHGKPGRGNPGDFLAKELHFSEAQMKQFQVMNQGHDHEMQLISSEIRDLKDALFANISVEEYSKKTIDSLTNLIGERQKEKDIRTFYHFKAIQDICDESQKQDFQRIVKDALHGHGKRRPPR